MELKRILGFVHVPAGDVQNAVCLPAGPLEYERGVRSARDAVGPGDLCEEVVGACLTDVVDEDDGDAVVVCEPLGVADGDVIRVVRGHPLRGLAAHLGEHVDDHHAGIGVAVQPLCDGLGAALGEGRAFGDQGQAGRGLLSAQEFAHAGLEAARGVFEGEVEHRPPWTGTESNA